MEKENGQDEGPARPSYTDVLKHQLNGIVAKAKEALQAKVKKSSPTEYCGRNDLTPASPSGAPTLPFLQSNLAHMGLSTMNLGTSAAEAAPPERAHSPATTYATAQAFVSHSPSASNATARVLSDTAERDASISDYHDMEEANNTEGAVLNSSDQNSAMARAPGNSMTRHYSGNGVGNDILPSRTVNGIYMGVDFDKSLPELPDPFLADAPDQTNRDSNNLASNGQSSVARNTIDPFYASGLRIVLHSPYNVGNNDGDRVKKIFSKQALIDMDHHAQHLEIDLFCPVGMVEAFPVSDLKPLWPLRELRSLKIVGMRRSYQEFIWEIVWKNPHMERLWMYMEEAPALSERAKGLGWHIIQGRDWAPRKLCEVPAKYHGHRNTPGRLHERNGIGEYLDANAIAEAKLFVMHAVKRDLPNYDMPAKLQIKELRLWGFVVDALVIRACFDEDVLESLQFGWDCVDAGFALSTKMLQDVEIQIPETGRNL